QRTDRSTHAGDTGAQAANHKLMLEVLIEATLADELDRHAAEHGKLKSEVVEKAIRGLLAAGPNRQPDELARQLDRLQRAVERIERDQLIATEALAVYVRHWIRLMPLISDPVIDPVENGQGRQFERFIESVSRALARGGTFSKEVVNTTAHIRGNSTRP
ncbi:MAG TPA: hypothetical protein VKN76_03800, partial [Kiloniellaceae bacterium]|nr:hypothetical protein [Kiloniellaceae bacterium]